jgi:hypothetical protein
MSVSETPAGLGAAMAANDEGVGDAMGDAPTATSEGEGEGEVLAMGDAAGLAATLGLATGDGAEVAMGGVVSVGAATWGAAGAHALAPTNRTTLTTSESRRSGLRMKSPWLLIG